jgi:hypothetical protein
MVAYSKDYIEGKWFLFPEIEIVSEEYAYAAWLFYFTSLPTVKRKSGIHHPIIPVFRDCL